MSPRENNRENNKDLLRRYFEEHARTKDPAIVEEVCAERYVNHTPPPGVGSDRDSTKRLYATYNAALPDWQVTLEDLLAEGDRAMARWRIRGTHEGELMGVPATATPVELTGHYLARCADGRIVESWEIADVLGLMQQLGVLPAPETPAADADDRAEGPAASSGAARRAASPGADTEQTRTVLERFNEAVYNEHRPEAIDELVASDFAHHAPIATPQGRDGLRQFLTGFWEAFPDATSTVEDTVADDDRAAVRYTMRATHRGEFMGASPSGNRIEVAGISIYRVAADGRVTDEWAQPDLMSMMQQLGLVPAVAEG